MYVGVRNVVHCSESFYYYYYSFGWPLRTSAATTTTPTTRTHRTRMDGCERSQSLQVFALCSCWIEFACICTNEFIDIHIVVVMHSPAISHRLKPQDLHSWFFNDTRRDGIGTYEGESLRFISISCGRCCGYLHSLMLQILLLIIAYLFIASDPEQTRNDVCSITTIAVNWLTAMCIVCSSSNGNERPKLQSIR